MNTIHSTENQIKLAYLKIIFDNYQGVNSLVNLVVGTIYRTKNYGMLKHLQFNRGTKVGYDEQTVVKFVEMYLQGYFIPEMSIVSINLDGISVDGNNRIEACKRLGIDVLFHICADAKINTKNQLKLTNILTIYNSYDPSWSRIEQQKCAESHNSPLALRLKALRDNLINNSKYLNERNLKTNLLMLLLDKFNLTSRMSKNIFEMFCNEVFFEYSNSEEYLETVRYICDVISALEKTKILFKSLIDTSKVVDQVIKIMRTEYTFNKQQFLLNVLHEGFLVSNIKVSTVRTKIRDLSAKVIEYDQIVIIERK